MIVQNLDLGTKVNVPGRQLRLDNQPPPATSYWNYEVVFFDGSTVNLLEFKSPEEFFDAFQVPKNITYLFISIFYRLTLKPFIMKNLTVKMLSGNFTITLNETGLG